MFKTAWGGGWRWMVMVWGLMGAIALLHPIPTKAQSSVETDFKVADLLPGSTALLVKIEHPDQLLTTLIEHPIRKKLEQLDVVREMLNNPELVQGQMLLGLFEGQIGMDWETAFRSVTHGGIYLAIDPATDGRTILIQAEDEAVLKRVAGTLLGWISQDAQDKGKPKPFTIHTYREFKVAKFEKGLLARWKNWLVLSDNKELAKTLADRMLDHEPGNPASDSLAGASWYRQAREMGRSGDVWAAVDLDTLRSAGIAPELFSGRTDNALVELVLGGVLDALEDADFAVLSARLDDDLNVEVAVPFSEQVADPAREYFFGPQHDGRAPQPLLPDNWVASLSSYRDLSGWWLAKEDLFEERVIAELAQVDSTLSTLFAGLDFGQEVLGAARPGVQIVVAEPTFDETVSPDIKLPAFALVAQMENPEAVQRRFKVAFQSLVGILNLELGEKGQPQLELSSPTGLDYQLTTANYLVDNSDNRDLFIYNFSPTIAFRKPYLIISSTRALGEELAELAGEANSQKTLTTNTRMRFDVRRIRNLLELNRESLVAQSMLEKGNDRQQAEHETDLLLAALESLDSGELDLQVAPDQMTLRFKLRADSEGEDD